MRDSVRGRWEFARFATLGGLALAGLILAACAPTSFPNGNNATCWTLVRSGNQQPTPTCQEPTESWTDFGDGHWVWRTCDSGGTTLTALDYDAANCRKYPTTLLNSGHGDAIAQIYFGQDDAGYPLLSVWCVAPDGRSYLAMTDTWQFADNSPPLANRHIIGTNHCAAPVDLYQLTSGEYAVNIGPDGEGKIASTIFAGPPPENIHFQDENVGSAPSQ